MNCPLCQKPTEPRYRPFCSKRCADVDLGRWFNGSYAIPAEDAMLGEAEEAEVPGIPDTRH